MTGTLENIKKIFKIEKKETNLIEEEKKNQKNNNVEIKIDIVEGNNFKSNDALSKIYIFIKEEEILDF